MKRKHQVLWLHLLSSSQLETTGPRRSDQVPATCQVLSLNPHGLCGLLWISSGFPGGSCDKELAWRGFDPRVRKIPWRRGWQPTPVFLPGKSYGQRSLAGYSPADRRAGHDWSDLACPWLSSFHSWGNWCSHYCMPRVTQLLSGRAGMKIFLLSAPMPSPPSLYHTVCIGNDKVWQGLHLGVISEVLLALGFYPFRLSVMDISSTWKWNKVEEIK